MSDKKDQLPSEDLPQLQIVEVEHTDRLRELESIVGFEPSAVEAPKSNPWQWN